MALNKYRLGDLLTLQDERNENLFFDLDSVRGISIQKKFIDTKADMSGVSLKPYILVKPGFFAYVPVTSRNGEKITIAFNDAANTYIVSSSYIVFSVSNELKLLPEFLFMYFNRPEFDRYARFNSWGSARETFSWDDMCDIEMELPSVEEQQKYVDIYKALKANQECFEHSLEDLKLSYDAILDSYKKDTPKRTIGSLLKEVDVRNFELKFKDVKGININKEFMPSISSSKDLKNYKIVSLNQFAYSSMQTGRDECIRLALHKQKEPISVSPAYSVLELRSNDVLPEYVMMWFCRDESDRLGWFMSDASIRANLDLDRFFEIEIPFPSMNHQKTITDLFKAYILRKELNERLKELIKNICPILIRGSLSMRNKQ